MSAPPFSGNFSLHQTPRPTAHEAFAYLAHLFEEMPLSRTSEDIRAHLPYRLEKSSYTANAE